MHTRLSFSAAHRRRDGFTLIELLVALGITALLVTLMLNIVVNVLNGWNRSSGTLSANGQATTVLNQLASDIQGAIMKRDGNVWLAATVQNDQAGAGDAAMTNAAWSSSKPTASNGSLVLNPATQRIQDCRFGQAGVWLRLFTIPSDDNSAVDKLSAPRAVAYQIVRRKVQTTATEIPYQLYRSEARPADVTSGGDSTFTAGYDLFMSASSTGYNKGSGTQADTGNIRQPNAAQLIGNNVIDFGVKFYASYTPSGATTTTMTEIFPIDRRGTTTTYGCLAATSDATKTPPQGVPTAGPVITVFPEEADIMVRILTDEGARLIGDFERGFIVRPATVSSDSVYWWQLAIQNSRVYTRHIQIKNTPL